MPWTTVDLLTYGVFSFSPTGVTQRRFGQDIKVACFYLYGPSACMCRWTFVLLIDSLLKSCLNSKQIPVTLFVHNFFWFCDTPLLTALDEGFARLPIRLCPTLPPPFSSSASILVTMVYKNIFSNLSPADVTRFSGDPDPFGWGTDILLLYFFSLDAIAPSDPLSSSPLK